MKRLSLHALLVLVFSFLFVSAASAMPGDCYDTCDIYGPCETATQSCQECIWEYDSDECIQWRETTCQQYGACGQCRELSRWTTTGPEDWYLYKRWCFTDPSPDKPAEVWWQNYYKYTWVRLDCGGTITTQRIGREYQYTKHCTKVLPGFCPADFPKTFGSPTQPWCPF